MYQEYLKEFKKDFKYLASRYGEQTVFADFVKMCAISIYNALAKNKEMEQEYLKTINTYDKEAQQLFPKMFVNLVMVYQNSDELTDVFSKFYENENLKNAHLGQFFTPSHISNFMGEAIICKEENINKIIEENGFITMMEPTCGAGGMILGFAKALKNHDINYQQELLVEAIDISPTCVYMTYIQLSLYGIPAIVYCGDTLSLKMNFKMETPFYFMNYWKFRKLYTKKDKEKQNENQASQNKIVIDKPIEKQILLKETIVKGNCQITLW